MPVLQGRDSNLTADDGKLNRKDKAMKYIIFDARKGNYFTEEYDNKEEAIREADKEWDRMTDEEKRHTVEFYVLESANPDEDAVNHFDGNFVKKYK